LRLLTLLLSGLAIYLVLRWLYNKNPQQFTRVAVYITLIWVAGFLVYMAVTGRLHWLFVLIAGLFSLGFRYLPIIFRLLPFLKTLRATLAGKRTQSKTSTGQTSSVRSRYLNMELNHDTGKISGSVIAGQFEGRDLAELEIDSFKLLLQEIQADRNSFELLNTYLEQRFGADYFNKFDFQSPDNSNGEQTQGGSFTDEMTIAQARDILGVDESATREDIIKAHRRMMQKFHPDRGGSNYLAAQINNAKQLLLKQ